MRLRRFLSKGGWNLIGADVTFTNDSGNSYTWATALANNKVQAYLAYYDSSPATASGRKYKYLSTVSGMDDISLRKNKGYWVYMNESGNLSLGSAGGSWANESYDVAKLRFSNGTDEKSFADAKTALWVENPQYWGRDDPEDDMEFMVLSSGNLNSWQGYFVKSSVDNLTLIRQN